MNTKTFKKVVVDLPRISQLISDAKALAEKEHLDISEEKAEKYQMKTLWKNRRPLYKRYKYKSGTGYFHDFENQINYQYIPAQGQA